MNKIIAIIGALIGGGLGIALIGSGTQADTCCLDHELKERTKMRKLLAIIGAMISCGLGIALIGSGTQAAHAAFTWN